MRSIAEFIGDEVTAAGYRLCGIDVRVADKSSVLDAIDSACRRTSLVLVGSSLLSHLSDDQRDEISMNTSPPVLIIDDMQGGYGEADIASRIHRQLGMLE